LTFLRHSFTPSLQPGISAELVCQSSTATGGH
jgi:hypothetical protein